MEGIIKEVKKLSKGVEEEVKHFVIYTKDGCSYCDKAFKLLEKYGESYTEVNVSKQDTALDLLKEAGFKTVPQVFSILDGNVEHIGGFDELEGFLTFII